MTKKKRIIYVNNKPIKVTVKVYKAYWEEVEKERYQNRLYRKNVNSLDMLFGSQEFNPLELKYLKNQSNIKENNNSIQRYELLVRALFDLEPSEVDLILCIYFDGMNQREYAETIDVTKQAISKKHQKIIKKLKKLINL